MLIALRENPRAAEAYGINALRTMLAGFAFSGFLAADRRRAVRAPPARDQPGHRSNNPFSAEASLRVFSIVVIGGLASVPGAILGAIYVFGMQYYMLPEWRFLATGVGLLAILLILPGGLGAGLAEARDGILRWSPGAATSSCRACVADRRADALEVTPAMAAAVADAVERPEIEEVVEMGTVTDRQRPDAAVDRRRRRCSRIGRHTVHRPRGPRRYFDDITGGLRALPAAHPVRPQRGRRARPHASSACSARRSATPSASPTRATSRSIALTLLGGLLLEVPLAYYADRLPPRAHRGARRGGVGVFGLVHRPRDDDPACS